MPFGFHLLRARVGLIFAGLAATFAAAAPVSLVEEAPTTIQRLDTNTILVDFGRVAFGNLALTAPSGGSIRVTVHFGEAQREGRVDRQPPGTVRYAQVQADLSGGQTVVVAPPPDARNTRQWTGEEKPDAYGRMTPPAVLTPAEWGVILPFRWVEITGWPGELPAEVVRRRSAFATTWDDAAAEFHSSDPLLDRIWELCRYSIKATSFAGVYVDGDRERIPYEADAYLNQLSHYATDRDHQMARDTFDWLMRYPTWPTEWAPHLVLMAHADWMHTGETDWVASRYEALKGKLLLERVREDGLVGSSEAQRNHLDIVDWPVAERDGFVFTPVNTVVNAFHLRALELMADLAAALGHERDAADYSRRRAVSLAAFNATLLDPVRGCYRDGIGTDHASQHANLFPLAFGLVPAAQRDRVTAYVASRGMACSVYAAQYLLEGLFENGAGDVAHRLIVAPNDRSWRHMVESGTTITWEAWDQRYKPNQDWNHAWGAAPANLLPRYVLGAQATAPGWTRVRIRPHPGSLESAEGTIPTARGPLQVRWTRPESFRLELDLPAGTTADVNLPAGAGSEGVWGPDGRVPAQLVTGYWILTEPVAGRVDLVVR